MEPMEATIGMPIEVAMVILILQKLPFNTV